MGLNGELHIILKDTKIFVQKSENGVFNEFGFITRIYSRITADRFSSEYFSKKIVKILIIKKKTIKSKFTYVIFLTSIPGVYQTDIHETVELKLKNIVFRPLLQ